MTHTYRIKGMSCNGCRTNVENALNSIQGVSAVVTLAPPKAVITMAKHISTKDFQATISTAGNYTIEDANAMNFTSQNEVMKTADLLATEKSPKNFTGNGKYYCYFHFS